MKMMRLGGLIENAWQILVRQGLKAFFRHSRAKVRRLLPPLLGGVHPGLAYHLPSAEEYRRWMLLNEPGADQLEQQRLSQEKLPYRPTISVVMPVFNTQVTALQAAIESLEQQTYPLWELCVADGGSNLPGIEDLLDGFARKDARIRVRHLGKNLGISGNSNEALRLANGDFVALFDHDDLLAPFALFEVASALNRNPELDLIYSDHDLLSRDGSSRRQPLFKPDWSPEIMLSANYITHLTVIRKAMLDRVGGFDPQFDGAQDWDLFLRTIEKTPRVGHIPKILYHWRAAVGSTADGIWAKKYAPPAQLGAIRAHLTRQGLPQADASFDKTGFIRVRWSMRRTHKVSIIIPSCGVTPALKKCVKTILGKTSHPDYEVVIINNGPRPPESFRYYRKLSSHDNVRILHYGGEFNYSAVNNYGADQSSGDVLLFLNDDVEIVDPGWLGELVMWAERDDVGIVGAKLLSPNRKIQHAGVILGLTGFAGHVFAGMPENSWTPFGISEWYRPYLAVTGACMMMRREVFERIGKFDENFTLCGSDVELCLRARSAGLRVIYNPFVRLIHLEGATRKGNVPSGDFIASYPHYVPFLQSGDPYFNPNLSYWSPAPALAQRGDQSPLDYVTKYVDAIRSREKGMSAHL